MPDWSTLSIVQSPELMLGLGAVSAALFVGSVFGALWAVKRLPEDYLVRDAEPRTRSLGGRISAIVRNVVGVLLVIAGLLMLFLPGQGVLTLLAGVSLMDFPGKRRLERRFMLRPKVLEVLNRWRRRAGHPPLRSH